MEIKKEMYVRFKDLTNYAENNITNIAKINSISEVMSGIDETLLISFEDYREPILKRDIIGEPSYNLIDLIEVGDYVNGSRVIEIENDIDDYGNDFKAAKIECCDMINHWVTNIKSIVTKEQFESMSYKVGEQKC